MRQSASYRFSGVLTIDAFRQSRVQSEKEYEEVHNIYAHHADPIRELRDVLTFDTFVFAGKKLTEDEIAAFTEAMTYVLRDFQYRFDNILKDKLQS